MPPELQFPPVRLRKTQRVNSASQRIHETLRRQTPILVLSFLLFLVLPATAAAANKKVLFLYGDKSNGVMMGYREVLQSAMRAGSPDRITFYEEYMDLSQYPGEEYVELLRSFYRQKYQGQKFDLIFAQAPSVLNFVSKYGEELFPGTPTVFGTLDKDRLVDVKLGSNVTGVLADFGIGQGLEAALQMQPNLRNAIVVSGTSPIDARQLVKVRTQFQRFEGRLQFTYLTGLAMEELEQRLAKLTADSAVFFVTIYRDGAGHSFAQMDAVARVAQASSVPTYCYVDRYLELGAIGGFVVSLDADAKEVAKVALRVLAGEKPADIPIRVADTNRYMFNWRQLQRWNIDERRLPPGSIVLFRVPSFWETYKWRIVAVISLCVLQALLIVWLLITRSRRRRALENLRESEERFRMMADTAPVMVWASGPDTLCTFFNRPWLEFTGRTMEQELGQGWAEGVHPDDHQRCLDVYLSAFRARRDFTMEYRLRRADGQYRWLLDEGIPRLLPNGELAGYIGCCLDITERRQSEQALQQLTGRLLMLQDEERQRVAAELHDGLGQNLAIIKNRAMIGLRDQADYEQARGQLEEIAATATASIVEVREIAHNLRPYELDRLGLVSAIESMIERVSDSTTIELSANLERIDGLLSAEAETSVYRIVQEGLNNVIKHSKATAASIEIKRTGNQLAITVRDNGAGISSPVTAENGNHAKGFGLVGIAERVRVLGGSLAVDSQPSRGTAINITLELTNGRRE